MNSICECTPGVFHPHSCHNEQGCVVDMHNRGQCPCTKVYDAQQALVTVKSNYKQRDMFYGDQRI